MTHSNGGAAQKSYSAARGINGAGVVAVLALLLAAQVAWAWGREGHRLTALVAEQYLTPEVKAQVAELLATDSKGKETLADVAPWADEYRTGHPETGAWHFVDIP